MVRRKSASSKNNQPEPSIVALAWATPDKPPHGSLSKPEPFLLIRKMLDVPHVGDPLSFELPGPEQAEPVIIPIPMTTAHGRVISVVEIAPIEKTPTYLVTIERQGRVGMDWNTLCHCIGATMVGFNEFIGRVEGRLIAVMPGAEIAILHVPSLTNFYLHEVEKERNENPNLEIDEDELEQVREEGATIWVPWAALWTKEGLEIMDNRKGN